MSVHEKVMLAQNFFSYNNTMYAATHHKLTSLLPCRQIDCPPPSRGPCVETQAREWRPTRKVLATYTQLHRCPVSPLYRQSQTRSLQGRESRAMYIALPFKYIGAGIMKYLSNSYHSDLHEETKVQIMLRIGPSHWPQTWFAAPVWSFLLDVSILDRHRLLRK